MHMCSNVILIAKRRFHSVHVTRRSWCFFLNQRMNMALTNPT